MPLKKLIVILLLPCLVSLSSCGDANLSAVSFPASPSVSNGERPIIVGIPGSASSKAEMSAPAEVGTEAAVVGFWNRQYALSGSMTFASSHLFRPDGTFTAFQRSELPPDVAARTKQATMQLMGLTVGKYRHFEDKIECYEAYHLSGEVLNSPWYEQKFGENYQLMDVMEMAVPPEYLQAIEPFSYEYKVIAPGPFLLLETADGKEELLASEVAPLPVGCWETTDRGDAQDGIMRQDITLEGKTVSIRADWKALEIALGNPGFSQWERDWQDDKWVVRSTDGIVTYDGEYLCLLPRHESLYEGTEFEAITGITDGVSLNHPGLVLRVREWDEELLDIEDWEPLHNFAGKDDKPPRVGGTD